MGIKLELHIIDGLEALYVDGCVYNQGGHDQTHCLENYLLDLISAGVFPLTIDELVVKSHEDGNAIDAVGKHVVFNTGRFPDTLEELADIEQKGRLSELKALREEVKQLEQRISDLTTEAVGSAIDPEYNG